MQRIGQLKQVTVWLVLLGFLCGLMGPSDSIAKVFREIDTEGDPTDGLGLTDGGGGSGGSSDSGVLESSVWDDYQIEMENCVLGDSENLLVMVRWQNGSLVFELYSISDSLAHARAR